MFMSCHYVTSGNFSICNPLKFILTKRFKAEMKILNVNMTISYLYRKKIYNFCCYFVAESFRVFYIFIFNFFYSIHSLIYKTDDFLIKS